MDVPARGVFNEPLLFQTTDPGEALQLYSVNTGIPREFLRGSQCSRPTALLDPNCTFQVSLRVLGGKGGFGSLLRGQGMVARVDNFESCKDLSGKRIRHLNDEIRLKEWKEKNSERKKTEKTRTLPQKRNRPANKHYQIECRGMVSSLKSAISEGLKRGTGGDILAKATETTIRNNEDTIIKKIKFPEMGSNNPSF